MQLKDEYHKIIVDRCENNMHRLSPFACKSDQVRRYKPAEEDIRPPFFHDIDKVMYSRAYTRYIDKTQVFYLIENDHVTHRVLHVQLVSKIARTIGRFLNLNEDLIEAISLGHDVGHTPFGHNGERIVSEFCRKHGCGIFQHNVQSFRLFHELENNGEGCNMSVQTLDGIICHNGESLNCEYHYNSQKTDNQLLEDYQNGMLHEEVSKKMIPMTLEGCVMRISDVIAYIGRDIEDAIVLKLIERQEIPSNVVQILGDNNRDIINNLIIDVVNNSFHDNYLHFTPEVFQAMEQLQQWNYDHIYRNPRKMVQDSKVDAMFNTVLDACLDDLERSTNRTLIWDNIDKVALQRYSKARIVADYVSGMTDDYLMNIFKALVVPSSFGLDFSNHTAKA